jgi:small subunit ribosomal protein S20
MHSPGRASERRDYRKHLLTLEAARGVAMPLRAILFAFVFLTAATARHISMATSTKAKKKTVRIASGRKRARQDVKLNASNASLRSKFRSAVKGVQKVVAGGDKAKATEVFKIAQSVIDSVADKGMFHKNKAARHKSRLAAKVKALATAA